MEKIFGLPEGCTNKTHSYCPGCMHGVAMNVLMHTIEKFGVLDNLVIVNPVGCGGLGLYEATANYVSAAHGRASAVATGIKRCSPESFVIAYQGDGDLAGIGIAETIHTAARGENITVFFANNTTYGMTGGQMAPTTMIGQASTTTPGGRKPELQGYPLKMAEMIAQLDAPAYVERVALYDSKHVIRATKAFEKAFEVNKKGGYAFIEMLTNCPTNWKMTPEQTIDQIKNFNEQVFPLGIFKDKEL